jgi:hypothetical protein
MTTRRDAPSLAEAGPAVPESVPNLRSSRQPRDAHGRFVGREPGADHDVRRVSSTRLAVIGERPHPRPAVARGGLGPERGDGERVERQHFGQRRVVDGRGRARGLCREYDRAAKRLERLSRQLGIARPALGFVTDRADQLKRWLEGKDCVASLISFVWRFRSLRPRAPRGFSHAPEKKLIGGG